MAGVARDEFGAGLRAIFVDNYAIYYIHDASEILIVRVLHGARDASAMAKRGGFKAQ